MTVNGFLAVGGDGFVIFKEATERRIGATDLAALVAYFEANNPISPGPLDRIRRAN